MKCSALFHSTKFNFLTALVVLATNSWAQNIRWATAADANPYETGAAYLVCDSMNNTYVLTHTTDAIRNSTEKIPQYPYKLNGCNDILLAKYNISGNLVWRKVFGGFNYPASGSIFCDHSFTEYPYALAYDPYKESLIIAFNYVDSMRINGVFYGRKFTPGVPPTLGDYRGNMIASVDLNGDFKWAVSLDSINLASFTGMTIADDGIYWAGKSWNDFKLVDKTVKAGYFIGKIDLNGNWLNVKNLVFDDQGVVLPNVQIRNPTIVNNDIVVECYLTGTSGFFGNIPFANTYGRNLNLVNLNKALEVVRYKLFYQDYCELPYGASHKESEMIPNPYSGLTLLQYTQKYEIYLNEDTLNGTESGTAAYVITLDSHQNLHSIKKIVSNTGILISTAKYSKNGDLYLLAEAGHYSYHKNTIISDESGVIVELEYGTVLLKVDTANHCTVQNVFPSFYAQDMDFDKFGRPIVLGYTSSPFSYQNVSSESIFSDDFFVLALSPTAYDPGQKHKTLIAYPNPTQDKFTIVLPDEFIDMPLEFKIMKTDMEIISFKSMQSSELLLEIDLSKQSSGVYHVVLSGNNQTYSCKIVLTH